MMRIWNSLEACCIAATVFTSYTPSPILPPFKFMPNSALLIALLLPPPCCHYKPLQTFICFTIYCWEHINCLCCCLSSYSLLFIVSCFLLSFSLSLLDFSNSCCVSFSALLDGVRLSWNKKITYLPTYLLTFVKILH